MALNSRFFELKVSDGTWDFEYSPNTGKIFCLEAHENHLIWCDHIEQAVIAGVDADAIWCPTGSTVTPNGVPTPVFEDEIVLMIPMFPTVGLWATVDLTFIPDRPIPMYRIFWDHPNGRRNQFIGNITNGEGRRGIREMLVEFMWAAPDREIECQAAHHGLAAQREWERLISTEFRTREAWSVYIYDWCTHCRFHEPDNSDLIPASENNGVWN